jgi:flagellar basal-body rod protein FlgB
MDYSGITLFKMMKAKMGYHAERQDQLAKNVSNIDTPGYKPEDLRPLEFHRLAMIEARRLRVRATNPNHITDTTREHENFRSDKMRKTYETTPVKNAVVLEEQMMHIAQNQMEYQKVTNLYSKVSTLFKTAIGNN